MSTLERAVEIAAKAHAGQVDKAGSPYLLHPLRVMLQMKRDEDRIAAVLHDVVEDTVVTLDDLKLEGFSQEILDAVAALTKAPGETRIDAAHRVAKNPVARRVKLADVADNMDLSRIAQPQQRDFDRLKEYEQVQTLLQETEKCGA